MARPSKTLAERVRDASFLARRHEGLLAGPLVGREDLRQIQTAYQATKSDRERRSLALDFEATLRAPTPSDVSEFDSTGSVADFFAANLIHRKGPAAGEPFVLEPWQSEFVEELYRLDERGQRIYTRAILGVPRGNGKSPIAAAVGLHELMTRSDEPDVICAAAARDQAGVVFEYARGFAETGPLAEHLVIGRREIARLATRGVLRTCARSRRTATSPTEPIRAL